GARAGGYSPVGQNPRSPATNSEHATGSPSMAGTNSPSKSTEIFFAAGFGGLRRSMGRQKAARAYHISCSVGHGLLWRVSEGHRTQSARGRWRVGAVRQAGRGSDPAANRWRAGGADRNGSG